MRQRVTERLLSLSEVLRITRLGRTTLHRERKANRFPEPVRPSAGRVFWRESVVRAWMAGLRP